MGEAGGVSVAETAAYSALPFLPPDCTFEQRADGSLVISPGYVMPPLWQSIPHLFMDRAQRFADRPFVARRVLLADGSRGDWRYLTYGDALAKSRALAESFISLGLGPDAGIAVLSGGAPEHMVVNLAAQMVRAPYAPLSVNYSLVGGDYARLRHCMAVCRPRLVYADDWRVFLAAMRALREDDPELILVTDEAAPQDETLSLAELCAAVPSPKVDLSIAAITLDTHAKTIFTSGSTGKPKGVIQTQRVLTGVVAQHVAMYAPHDPDHAPAFLTWIPWSHVGGNNTIVADVLNEAGCFYVDDGRPLPGQFAETIRNLRELSLEDYGSTPIFFSELVTAMEADEGLRDHFFARLRFLSYASAGLSEDLFRRLQALAIAATGRRAPVITKYGTSETQGTTIVTWPLEQTGPIGLPFAGNVLKLAPVGDQFEIRVKGVTVAPGYLGDPLATEQAFDEEGFYRTGDAARLVDPQRLELGIAFDGRVTENFKLQSATWVHVSTLRMELINALDPVLQDAVIVGEGRADIRALGWLRLADAQRIARTTQSDAQQLAAHPRIAAHVAQGLAAHNAQAHGLSGRIAALRLLIAPPAGDEIADKGYINQREVQRRRPDDVAALYRGEAIFPASAVTDWPKGD